MSKQIDVLIIGAGISGIGLAAHLAQQCPKRQFAILEARESIGGTWDLFRYPGIRSDSDMTTFGYRFKPWRKASVLADAASIRGYLSEVVDEQHLREKIYFGHRVIAANYDSATKQWWVEVINAQQEKQTWIANFIFSCTGYYDYAQGFLPHYPNQTAFQGQLIHPQHWPESLDYQGKKIVVIGSGATAITLVPALVQGGAGHVTMLQRSPTYIASISALDQMYHKLRKWLPEQTAYQLIRGRNIVTQRLIYALARKYPQLVRTFLLHAVKKQLQGKVDMKHFTPHYFPWEQRLCVVPDGDLFQVLRDGQASVVTDEIEHFTEHGIQLKSGQHLDADIIVSATGLQIQVLGGIQATVDGKPIDPAQHLLYQGMMLNNVPNLAMMIGYINASWTLKVDIVADYLCSLLNYMDQQGYAEVMPAGQAEQLPQSVMGGLTAGYIQRATHLMPKQGATSPWKMTNNYLADRKALKHASFEDGILTFRS
ncbi:flavin-containing monooxygenase [Acinetobacter sp. CAAS 2-6]|uniref:flavin-containing monooxygenase n=1 Tax=Acinetobacter sp. CAAS 2-6 TaxID=3016358 RepID=UPI002DD67AD0|nr:NAD(P)/FAD-dependent oxidoreductase [Acinetobacter sp. CAAS 2-6]